MAGYLTVLLVAGGITLLTTPLVRSVAMRIGVVQAPDERRVHTRPTPVLGGLSMYLGLLGGMAVATQLSQFDPVFHGTSEPIGIVLGATIIFIVGLVDDIREVSPPAKLAGQVLAASVLSLLGVTMLFFRLPFLGLWSLSPDMAPLVTVLWVAGMSTAINYIDGLDGLAAGIVAIGAGAFALYSHHLFDQGLLPNESNSISPLVAVIVLGMCVGFLPWNFHPARIFMGDSGALLLGLLMASSTLLVGGQTAESTSGTTFFFFAPLLIPLVILGVPIFDTAFSIVRRAAKRTSVSVADKDHLHHRLMRIGHGQRRAVLILWGWTAVLSGLVLVPVYTKSGNAVVPFGLAAMGILLFTVLHPEVRRQRADQLELDLEVETH
ncbi:MAG: UDP-GlcNAc:undecaprenyl-phosphate/decaprenyl-phosphate GlcNAc-phosphate transferase [Actinomycetota bacterium]|jgi:UDP-GlcNAc:undecaprenyl-phosphate GlcNAc-1-phosphate transferase|nr:UDP-GlcNAc:undecaprenyl-phosphate/decaprenyl-phosphate GlcNAc-phosphate transferase [Actinomycetota bacterium]